MWYPSQEQQQHYGWYGYNHHPSSPQQQQQQQQQTYSRSSYYYNDDEFSTTCVENESPVVHCQTSYNDSYVFAANNFYGDEMSSYPIRKPYWNPVIAAPNKTMTPSLPASPTPRPSSSSDCWDWLLFSPQYYSEFYTPSLSFVHHQKFDDEENEIADWNFLASLPTCLLALLYLTPKLIRSSKDENDHDQEITSLRQSDEVLIEKENRSSTPDTDDGYQSASDYSQQLSASPDQRSNDDIPSNEQSLPTRRVSYAAVAVKPVVEKSPQISKNEVANSNGQKMKFIAPRFERMHHAKQNASSPSSNRTQGRSNNNHHHQHNPTVNPTRRR